MKKFKRKESFRYIFDEPIDGKFSVMMNGKPLTLESFPCKIIDISPRGVKIFTEADLAGIYTYENRMLKLEIHFILDVMEIKTYGQIRWGKKYESGTQLGLRFNQLGIEEIIVKELKRRRRKEVFSHKYNF